MTFWCLMKYFCSLVPLFAIGIVNAAEIEQDEIDHLHSLSNSPAIVSESDVSLSEGMGHSKKQLDVKADNKQGKSKSLKQDKSVKHATITIEQKDSGKAVVISGDVYVLADILQAYLNPKAAQEELDKLAALGT